MTLKYTSQASKELILQYVLENIEFRKKCRYLQEIITLSKDNEILSKMLTDFFEKKFKKNPLKAFCKN
ncbi:MAG TPA: hypothetical protein VMZ03_08160 [Chitinophagaceae bacterium]|nr:hypothetical protein [Chitinophagaceae bacterium]